MDKSPEKGHRYTPHSWIILVFLVGFLLFSIFSWRYISKISFYQPVSILVQGPKSESFKEIKFYCTTPFGREFQLKGENGLWYSGNFALYSNILANIDDSLFNKIRLIRISSGNVTFNQTPDDFKKTWTKRTKDSFYISPPEFNGRGPVAEMILSARYWKLPYSKLLEIIITVLILFFIIRIKP